MTRTIACGHRSRHPRPLKHARKRRGGEDQTGHRQYGGRVLAKRSVCALRLGKLTMRAMAAATMKTNGIGDQLGDEHQMSTTVSAQLKAS